MNKVGIIYHIYNMTNKVFELTKQLSTKSKKVTDEIHYTK